MNLKNVFGAPKKSKAKSHRRYKSSEEKREEFVTKRAMKLIQGDPIAEAKYINTILKSDVLAIPIKDDPIKSKKRKIEERILDESLSKLDSDDDLISELAEDKARDIAAGGGGMGRGTYGDMEYGGRYSGGEKSTVEMLDEVDMLKKRLGGGGLSSLINAETVNNVISLVNTMLANKAGGGHMELQAPDRMMLQAPTASPTKIYVVEIEGETVELDQRAYDTYIKAIKEEPTIGGEGDNGKEEVKDGKPISSTFDISTWVDFIESNEADGFVSLLLDSAKMGDTSATILITTLQSNTVDELLVMLDPFKEQTEYTYAIQLLNTDKGKAWLGKVLEGLPKAKDKK